MRGYICGKLPHCTTGLCRSSFPLHDIILHLLSPDIALSHCTTSFFYLLLSITPKILCHPPAQNSSACLDMPYAPSFFITKDQHVSVTLSQLMFCLIIFQNNCPTLSAAISRLLLWRHDRKSLPVRLLRRLWKSLGNFNK